MKVVIQRVSNAQVEVHQQTVGKIAQGLLVLVGIETEDTPEDADWLANKIIQMRIFNDENHVMNLSVKEVKGNILLISQFTLHASTKKGNRPSYIKAAKPEIAIPLYQHMIQKLSFELGQPIQTGQFGADMKVSLVNDGPVTIVMDSKNRE
jgi:D-tyrosyl-tRNA(Tyr) deacylase